MYKVRTYNQISVKGLERFPREHYEVASEISHPDALMMRSYKLSMDEVADTTLAIGRAGAGVNNIPVEACTQRGIPVFNAPGANANAVRELVLAGLLLGSRGVVEGIDYANGLGDMDDYKAMSSLLEKEKKQFKGNELAGKTLGVVGLGAIGSKVAKTCLMLGMDVIGYDPALSVDAAWRLPSEVKKMEALPQLFARADYITLHLPAIELLENSPGQFDLVCQPGLPGFAHVLMGVLRAMADDYGDLVILDHRGTQDGAEVISITLVETDFAEGRTFDLGAHAL